jgi:hypothetical protein
MGSLESEDIPEPETEIIMSGCGSAQTWTRELTRGWPSQLTGLLATNQFSGRLVSSAFAAARLYFRASSQNPHLSRSFHSRSFHSKACLFPFQPPSNLVLRTSATNLFRRLLFWRNVTRRTDPGQGDREMYRPDLWMILEAKPSVRLPLDRYVSVGTCYYCPQC